MQSIKTLEIRVLILCIGSLRYMLALELFGLWYNSCYMSDLMVVWCFG